VTEATALGAGALAGLGTGLWDLAALGRLPFDAGRRVTPALPEAARARARRAWEGVLSRSLASWRQADAGQDRGAGGGGMP